MDEPQVLGLRVELTRAVGWLMLPAAERPDPAILAAAHRDLVTASASALGQLPLAR